MFKSTGIAEALKNNLKGDGVKIAFIYGSYAKEQESLLSDIDLMIIGDLPSKEVSGLLSKPKRELMREINYAVFSQEEFINRLRQKDNFLNSVLKSKKIFIVGGENEFKEFVKSGQAKEA
ncbi:MAG: nucleotidyltransferase domain-containing protein [Candidatus Omnitrophota bacterium]|nr:nucleotidyltransferase domain-containing protein [Candidatus Omnitrophota bacterium]